MERNLRFDFYKGFLMFGVIWGHLITCLLGGERNDISIHWMLRTYDMPFFMFISGYFLAIGLQRKNIKQMLLDKVTTILLPTVFWSLLCSMFRAWDMFYFLWAVFYSSVFVTCANMASNKVLRYSLLFAFGIGLSCFDAPFYNMSYLYPFFVLGYVYKEEQLGNCVRNLLGRGGWFTIIFVIYIVCLCFWETKYSIWHTNGNILSADLYKTLIIVFRLLIGCLGIIVVKHLADILYAYMEESNNWFYRLMIKSGKETMMIYIFQNAVIFSFGKKIVAKFEERMGCNPFSANHPLLGYVLTPIITVFILYGLLTFITFVKKNKYTAKTFGFKCKL